VKLAAAAGAGVLPHPPRRQHQKGQLDMGRKEYTGTAYIGVVGPDMEYGICRDSIQAIQRRPGDGQPIFIRATKGYVARQMHINKFIDETHHDFILLLDHDMTFPIDTLDKLRGHGLPYTSGYYLRRRHEPIAPVWYDANPKGLFPAQPMANDPDPEKLHKLGASGWGCILMHRDMVIDIRQRILNGEWEVIEDDMDVYPYDLGKVMRAINCLVALKDTEPESKEFEHYEPFIDTLEAEIKPLRGDWDVEPIGSDIRYPMLALKAGYQLWGDASVRCGHILHYPLKPDDYTQAGDPLHKSLNKNIGTAVRQGRKTHRQNMVELGVWHE